MKELKSQLAELQEKVNKLNWVEEKLIVLEEKLQGKVIIDERDWNNLLSRVLLLETQLLLQPEKVHLIFSFQKTILKEHFCFTFSDLKQMYRYIISLMNNEK